MDKISSRIVVRCSVACLGLARSKRPRLVLALAVPRVLAPRDLSQICKYAGDGVAEVTCPRRNVEAKSCWR
jgi:hypothetical protein